MKILIIRNIPTRMDVRSNTYNIQEVGLAKALIRRGQICDVLFWTDGTEETVTLPVEKEEPAAAPENVGTGETGNVENSEIVAEGRSIQEDKAFGAGENSCLSTEGERSGGDGPVVHVYYCHAKSFLKNAVFADCEELFAQYDVLQPCEYNQMQSWLLAKSHPEKTIVCHGPYYSDFNKRYNLMCRAFDLFCLRRYIRMGTRFLAKSELAREFLIGKGVEAENVRTVGVGMDAQMFRVKAMSPNAAARAVQEGRASENPYCKSGEDNICRTKEERTQYDAPNRRSERAPGRPDGGKEPKHSSTEMSDEIPPLLRTMREDPSDLKLLYVGQWEKRRNLPFLIEVFREVLVRHPSAKLYLIGRGEESYVQMVEQCMEQAGVKQQTVHQVRMEQRYLAGVYQEADFFLLPTKYEIFGMVLLEAMYYGKVVLTTENGGSSMLIRNGENGFVLDDHDAAAWAEQICKVHADPDGERRIGEKAHHTVAEQYTWDALAGRFLEEYGRVTVRR